MTPRGTTRILKSEGGAADDRLRVFVAEGSASDLFWLEMVFKSSRLPYTIEAVMDVEAARFYLEQHSETNQPDLIFIDTFEILDQLPVAGNATYFVLTNASDNTTGFSSDPSLRLIEKPFTHDKLLDCLSAAALDSWATRLSGKAIVGTGPQLAA